MNLFPENYSKKKSKECKLFNNCLIEKNSNSLAESKIVFEVCVRFLPGKVGMGGNQLSPSAKFFLYPERPQLACSHR